MRVVDTIGGILMAIVGVAALSLIIAPNSQFAGAVKASGEAFTSIINAAKGTST